jgi:hypothetical protein
MIQLIVNTVLLREIDERKLINLYGKNCYNSDIDVTDDNKIKENLKQILDWDINGDNGLGIYCSKFEGIKQKDWNKLIKIIKENHYEIKNISYSPIKERKLKSIKIINDVLEAKEQHNIKRFTDENYKVSGRGKKARSCIYKGKEYKSRQECIYKEGITKYQLYEYLKKTNQINGKN